MSTQRILRSAVLALLGGFAASALAVLPPEMADLVKVKSKRLEAVYLLPDTDFKVYKKVMIDPAQVSFAKNWLKDINSQRGVSSGKITQEQAQQVANEARSGFGELFQGAFKKAGYEIATAPGPDVIRLTPAVINLYVNAPASGSSATRTYAVSAGQASFVLAARDSVTGALIGVALDKRETRSSMSGAVMTDGVTNRAEFDVMFRRWAEMAVKGFSELRESPPVPAKK